MNHDKRIGLLVSLGVAAILMMAAFPVRAAITYQTSVEWYGSGKTVVHGVYAAETDRDGTTEIITVGEVYNGPMAGTKAQMKIWSWDSVNQRLTNERTKEWYFGATGWTTVALSVFAGDLDHDTYNEIVVVGYASHSNIYNNDLTIWEYNTMTSDYDKVYEIGETEDTMFNSVYAANIDTSTDELEIVVAGVVFGPSYESATLDMFNYHINGMMSLVANTEWDYNNADTNAKGVYAANLDSTGTMEIITAGYRHVSGVQNAEASVWTYSTGTLNPEASEGWDGGGDSAEALSVFAADVGGSSNLEIIVCGNAYDSTYGMFGNLQTFTYSSSTMTFDREASWQYSSADTECHGVYAGNLDGSSPLDIVTAGTTIISSTDYGQVIMWNYGAGTDIDQEDSEEWHTWDDTEAHAVFIGNVDSDVTIEIVTGGQAYDGTRIEAQLRVWYWS
jgi:hypothetical protein